MKNANQITLLNNLLMEEIKKYSGLNVQEIKDKLHLNVTAKNKNIVIFNRIIDASIHKNELKSLLKSCSCIVKTVNLEWNNSLKESMSLNVFKYTDIANEDWETSTLRKYFSDNIFIFVIFKKGLKDSRLENIKIWKMPTKILDSGVKSVWLYTQNLICKGKIVNYVDERGRYITYFPTSGETKYLHVRPHALNREDTLPLPVEDIVTKQKQFVKHSFWLNSNFIKKIVVEDKYYE